MYNAQFGLTQDPFSIAPDPRFLYMSERHREALAHLLYGAQGGGGLVLLTGAVGAGKTTVCRGFIEQLPKTVDLAYVFNPALSVPELLATICEDFGLQGLAGATAKAQVDALNRFLLERHAQGRSCVLIIDEAQNLAPDVLEQLRLLTNLETSSRKLLQIVLIGQPELRDRLHDPALEQVAQRIVARYHLEPLNETETPMYVRHRLAVAGLVGPLPFDEAALRRIHRLTGGVPRRINLLCDRALLGAYAQQRGTVSAAMVVQAAREVFGNRAATPAAQGRRVGLGAAGLVTLAAVAATVWIWQRPAGGDGAVSAEPKGVAAAAEPIASPALPWTDAATLVAQPAWPGEDAAYRALAELWSVPAGALSREAPVCGQTANARLACHRGQGTLALLRLLDRPVWLALQLDEPTPAPVLLTALGEREATLRLPAGRVRVSLATLTARWSGEFGTLWRLPPGLEAGAPVQTATPAADWVQARLAQEQAGALPADVSATVRIQAFQRSQGLAVDGVPGPLTLMQLNRAAGMDEPRLSGWPHSQPAAPRPGTAADGER